MQRGGLVATNTRNAKRRTSANRASDVAATLAALGNTALSL